MNHLPIYGISPRNKMSEKADTTTLLPKTYMPCSSSRQWRKLTVVALLFQNASIEQWQKLLELRIPHHPLLPAPKQQNDTYTIKTVFLRSDNKI